MSLNLTEILGEVMAKVAPERGRGRVADYIPALAEIDPRKLGIAIAAPDGSTCTAGDSDEPFSIQSISKVFMLALALKRHGDDIWHYVGREPSGNPFNSIVQLERERGIPRNPLINAGAIVVTDRVVGDRAADEAVAELVDLLRLMARDDRVSVDDTVAQSESRTGARNRSLAHFIDAFGNLQNPVEVILGVYFRQCALAMSCRQLAEAALFLAFDGTDPVTGTEVVTPARCRRINALMMTCGHYDNSGDFAFRVGLPGKSGVGGGVLVVVPGRAAVAAWSPGLNEAGTSFVGSLALEDLAQRTGWSVFS